MEIQWISCDERQPETPRSYLVDEQGDWFKARYRHGQWFTDAGLLVVPNHWLDLRITSPYKQKPIDANSIGNVIKAMAEVAKVM